MLLQISSGQGPAECEYAVGLLFRALQKEYPDIEMLYAHPSREKNCYRSILFATKQDLSHLDGSVQWICQSPFRPHHKRKNWFIDVSVIPETEMDHIEVKEEDLHMERFHSGGKGGQNVNKVETGVRLVHVPTGIMVASTAERTQAMNRADALRKLKAILLHMEHASKADQKNAAWREHSRLQRGNPVRVYRGMDFQNQETKSGYTNGLLT